MGLKDITTHPLIQDALLLGPSGSKVPAAALRAMARQAALIGHMLMDAGHWLLAEGSRVEASSQRPNL